ncbi:MAG TPA: sigma-70 family RNA polymerase sigma factor [Polyangiaceae bacterium]
MEATFGRTAVAAPDAVARRARVDRMVRAHFGLVWRYLRRLGLSEADADDGAQQVFLTFARKLDAVDPDRERSFLLGVALRVASDARRAHKRRRLEPETALSDATDPRPDPEQALDRQQVCALLDTFLEELDQDARAVFVLYEVEGLTMREIAEALELSPGTVASRLKRARTRFESAVVRYQTEQPTTTDSRVHWATQRVKDGSRA